MWWERWVWLVSKFSVVLSEIVKIRKGVEDMSAIVEKLREDIQQLKTEDEGLKQLVLTLIQQVRDNAEDPVALRQIADDVEAHIADIQQFVKDNTPAADQPTA